MAIARGAGTEIIRSHLFDDIDSTSTTLIKGVQHHIYTVLSVTCFCQALNAAGNWLRMYIGGYDAKGGTTDSGIIIFEQEMMVGETYVWNDKFSFNGFEPTNFTGPMDDATKQDAIADQGSSVSQVLGISSEHASDNYEVTVTFIDQNNA
tara:strand:+ start:1545 stop:1994 length:450 start_codon:yes stop_codon:yes gene_type:complete